MKNDALRCQVPGGVWGLTKLEHETTGTLGKFSLCWVRSIRGSIIIEWIYLPSSFMRVINCLYIFYFMHEAGSIISSDKPQKWTELLCIPSESCPITLGSGYY